MRLKLLHLLPTLRNIFACNRNISWVFDVRAKNFSALQTTEEGILVVITENMPEWETNKSSLASSSHPSTLRTDQSGYDFDTNSNRSVHIFGEAGYRVVEV